MSALLGLIVLAAGSQEPPKDLRFRMHYTSRNGLSVPCGTEVGLLQGSLSGASGIAAGLNALKNMDQLFAMSASGNLPKTTGDTETWMQDPGITMTAATLLPTSSLFTADVDATLSWDAGREQFRAKSGKVTFQASDTSDFHSGDHELYDALHASGSTPIKPGDVTLKFDDEEGTYTLHVSTRATATLVGQTGWLVGHDAKIAMTLTEGGTTKEAGITGMMHTEHGPPCKVDIPIPYDVKDGETPKKGSLHGTDVWMGILGNPTTVNWQVGNRNLELEIVEVKGENPDRDSFIASDKEVIHAIGKVDQAPDLEDQIEWTVTPEGDHTKEADVIVKKGKKLKFHGVSGQPTTALKGPPGNDKLKYKIEAKLPKQGLSAEKEIKQQPQDVIRQEYVDAKRDYGKPAFDISWDQVLPGSPSWIVASANYADYYATTAPGAVEQLLADMNSEVATLATQDVQDAAKNANRGSKFPGFNVSVELTPCLGSAWRNPRRNLWARRDSPPAKVANNSNHMKAVALDIDPRKGKCPSLVLPDSPLFDDSYRMCLLERAAQELNCIEIYTEKDSGGYRWCNQSDANHVHVARGQ